MLLFCFKLQNPLLLTLVSAFSLLISKIIFEDTLYTNCIYLYFGFIGSEQKRRKEPQNSWFYTCLHYSIHKRKAKVYAPCTVQVPDTGRWLVYIWHVFQIFYDLIVHLCNWIWVLAVYTHFDDSILLKYSDEILITSVFGCVFLIF